MDYLVDAEGKLVTDDTVYVEVGASGNPNACVLSLCSQNQELSDIIAAWGKTTAVFSSQELGTTDYTITIGDDFVNVVEETATPALEDFHVTILCTPTLPVLINNQQSLEITKSDGTTWTKDEILNIKINGVSSTNSGDSIKWEVGFISLFYTTGSATDVATIGTPDSGGVTVTTVEFAE